jgi:hypothetical protein
MKNAMLLLPPSSFLLLGERDYVQGVELFKAFLHGLAGVAPSEVPVHISAFKIHRQVNTHGRWVIGQDETGNAAAELHYVTASGKTASAFFDPAGPVIVTRGADPATSWLTIAEESAFSGRATVAQGLDACGFIRAIVDTNKVLHQRTLHRTGIDSAKISFLYFENFQVTPLPTADKECTITFALASTRTVAHKTYTLSKIGIEDLPYPTLTLCFNYYT